MENALMCVLQRRKPEKIVFAPNFWQWFAHHKNHDCLPEEIRHCKTQAEVIRELELTIFSRNVYCDQQRNWFGGLSQTELGSCTSEEDEMRDGNDIICTKR